MMSRVPRLMRESNVIGLVREYMPTVLAQFERVAEIKPWTDGTQGGDEHDHVFIPKENEVNEEYKDLAARAKTPWGGLITSSLAQTLFLTGVHRTGSADNIAAWKVWRQGGWDTRQDALYRAQIEHGVAYVSSLPAKVGFNKQLSVKMRGHSAERMVCFYDDENDEWPLFAIRAEPTRGAPGQPNGWNVWLWDEAAVYSLSTINAGEKESDWTYNGAVDHPAGVTPICRYANRLDLDGRAVGEIEPLIPLLARIDQDTFDRLIVQRFGAWVVRWIAGMELGKDGKNPINEKLRLAVESILVAKDPNTKFGTLDATPLDGFIASEGADLRTLSAVSQTPPHHLLGLSSNMQAESLAAAEAGLNRKSAAFRTSNGESWEQQFRLNSLLLGLNDDAVSFDTSTAWKDPETRSLSQAADALGKIATQLGVPVEMLWRKLPNWQDGDDELAKKLIQTRALDTLVAEIEAQGGFLPAGGGTGQDERDLVDA